MHESSVSHIVEISVTLLKFGRVIHRLIAHFIRVMDTLITTQQVNPHSLLVHDTFVPPLSQPESGHAGRPRVEWPCDLYPSRLGSVHNALVQKIESVLPRRRPAACLSVCVKAERKVTTGQERECPEFQNQSHLFPHGASTHLKKKLYGSYQLGTR